jgi:ABC-2 type transport system permease protein
MTSTTGAISITVQPTEPARAPHPGLLLPALSLCRRELVRFLRQRHRIIGALATPIVFWLLIGGGMGRSFRGPGVSDSGGNYLQFFFPGTILMILLFTAIFSTISIIEDRREGFLQSVLVAPVPRMAIVLGKVLGGTVLAFGQALLFLLLAPTVGIHPPLAGLALAALMMAILAFSLTALGFCIAWRMNSTQGFHAIMNLFLMPLWFLSGALFPAEGAMGGLKWIMRLNPLSYGLTGLREAIYWGHSQGSGANAAPGFGVCLIVSVAFAAALFLLASAIARSRATGDFE